MNNDTAPGERLLSRVRAGFVAQGSSLHRWCEEHDVRNPNARQAIIGAWNGPKGAALRNRILQAAGITEVSL